MAVYFHRLAVLSLRITLMCLARDVVVVSLIQEDQPVVTCKKPLLQRNLKSFSVAYVSERISAKPILRADWCCHLRNLNAKQRRSMEANMVRMMSLYEALPVRLFSMAVSKADVTRN